jgi:hypothetical protein
MAMSEAFRNLLLDGGDGCDVITHLGLVDETDTEITGGSPAYARVAVTWAAASGGVRRPTADLAFNIPASTIVGGWHGFTASSGGTDYGGDALTQETFVGQGQYTLSKTTTGLKADVPA